MSLILEALRKSEAERRRGDAPDLRVELPPPAPPKSRLAPAAWAAVGALLAALVLVALWPRDDAGDAGSTQDPDRAAARTSEPPSTWPDSASRDAMASRDAAAGRPRTAPAVGGFPRVERIQAAGAAPAPEPAADRPLAPPPMAVRAAEEAAAAADRTGAETAAAPRDAKAPLSPRPAAPATAVTDDALRIAGLSSSQRERLPGLKLSLHMWNDDPARRFAVIDGQRRVEGDRVGDATITAIDRDGVLLDLDGLAVRVPLP